MSLLRYRLEQRRQLDNPKAGFEAWDSKNVNRIVLWEFVGVVCYRRIYGWGAPLWFMTVYSWRILHAKGARGRQSA